MNENNDNTDWLNDYPDLKKQNRENPFRVPDNFFEEHQERIHSAIYADELKLKIPSEGFSVPDGYFEKMQDQVLSVIQLEGLRTDNETFTKPQEFFNEQQSIISARIKINEYAVNGSGFTVPENYFNELTAQINQKTGIKEAQPKAKVRNLFTKSVFKYAVAASVAIVVAAGISIKQYQSAHDVQKQLSNLPDADIEHYLEINSDSYDNHLILEDNSSDAGINVDNNTTGTKNNTNAL